MPMDRGLYPLGWEEIALRVKARAHWRCELCRRQCRRPGSTCRTHRRTLTVHLGGAQKGRRLVRYTLEDAIRLQGLPEGFLRDAPFTERGKLKAIANGVPIPTGRAVARAVRAALNHVHALERPPVTREAIS